VKAGASARDVLLTTLGDVRDSLGARGQRFLDELVAHLSNGPHVALDRSLVEFAGPDRERREAFADIVGRAARRLAHGDDPPLEPAAATTWQGLVAAVDRLYGSGAYPLGSLPFVSDRLLGLLLDEARHHMPAGSATDRRTTRLGGDVLARLAVSRQLRDAVTHSLGVTVVPTYDAVYEYDPAGSHVRAHVDARHYPIVFHLILEHTQLRGGLMESVLVTHHPGEAQPRRHRLRPGEAVVLRGRGTIHSWQAIGADEHRTLLAIGFDVTSSSDSPARASRPN
jgi:hypothetical protein